MSKIACKTTFNMNLPALVRSSQQDVYMSLTILWCTVNCRFRFADCPLIHFDEQRHEKTKILHIVGLEQNCSKCNEIKKAVN